MDERMHGGAGLELEAGRPAEPVPGLRVDDLPIAHSLEVDVAFGFALADELPLLDRVGVAVGVFRPGRQRVGVAFDHGVVRSVDLHVEPCAKDVLMDMADDARRHFGTETPRLTRMTSR